MSYTGRRSDVDQGKTDFTPLAGARRRQRWTRTMVHGKNRIPYRIDRRLPGLAEPDYDATISFGLPFELGDCPYGESLLKFSAKVVSERSRRKTGKQWHDDYDYATRNAAILSLDGMGFRQREIAGVVDISRRCVGQILQALARKGEPEFWEPYT